MHTQKYNPHYQNSIYVPEEEFLFNVIGKEIAPCGCSYNNYEETESS